MNLNRFRYPLTAALLRAFSVEDEPIDWSDEGAHRRRVNLAAQYVGDLDAWRSGSFKSRPWWHPNVSIPSSFGPFPEPRPEPKPRAACASTE